MPVCSPDPGNLPPCWPATMHAPLQAARCGSTHRTGRLQHPQNTLYPHPQTQLRQHPLEVLLLLLVGEALHHADRHVQQEHEDLQGGRLKRKFVWVRAAGWVAAPGNAGGLQHLATLGNLSNAHQALSPSGRRRWTARRRGTRRCQSRGRRACGHEGRQAISHRPGVLLYALTTIKRHAAPGTKHPCT